MNAKRKGTRNEHRSIEILEAAGYRCIRAAASLGCVGRDWSRDSRYRAAASEDARLARFCGDAGVTRTLSCGA